MPDGCRNVRDDNLRGSYCVFGIVWKIGEPMQNGAIISECGKYRYSLTREWGNGARVLWVMLNPSTADASLDDPTIRCCIGFSQSFSLDVNDPSKSTGQRFGSLEVVNLFAFRATDPKDMETAKSNGVDIVGPENDRHIVEAASRASLVVAAWGADKLAPLRSVLIRKLVAPHELYALGKSKSGAPKHPLYLPSNSELVLL